MLDPLTCPTCGSDKREVRLRMCPIFCSDDSCTCNDPWHDAARTATQEEEA